MQSDSWPTVVQEVAEMLREVKQLSSRGVLLLAMAIIHQTDLEAITGCGRRKNMTPLERINSYISIQDTLLSEVGREIVVTSTSPFKTFSNIW